MGFFPFLVRAGIAVALCAVATVAGAETLMAGAAKTELPVEAGMPLDRPLLAGGATATAVRDAVWARALYLEQDGFAGILLTLDCFRLTPALRQRILALAPATVPRENIVITTTMIANGPGGTSRGLAWRAGSGPFTSDTLDAMARAAAEAMRLAVENMERATIGVGSVNQEVLTRNSVVEDGPTDPTIGCVRVDNADGIPIALLGRFSALPDTIPTDDREVLSADFVGAYYTHLESLAAENCVAFFLNGAPGDQACANPENLSGWDRTESIGRLLAIRVKEAANDIRGAERAINVTHATVSPPPSEARAFMPATCTFHRLTLGDLDIWFIPAMATVSVANALQEALARPSAPQPWIVSGGNGNIGVIAGHAELGRFRSESMAPLTGLEGPGWLTGACAQVGATSTDDDEAPDALPAPKTSSDANEPRPALLQFELSGDAEARAADRARRMKPYLADALTWARHRGLENLGIPVRGGLWEWAPAAVDRAAGAMPEMLVRLRGHVAGFPEERVEEAIALARSLSTTVDALWLVQHVSNAQSTPPLIWLDWTKPEDEDAPTETTIILDGQLEGPVPLAAVVHVESETNKVWSLENGLHPGGVAMRNESGITAIVSVPRDAPGATVLPLHVAAALRGASDATAVLNGVSSTPVVPGAMLVVADGATSPRLLFGDDEWTAEPLPNGPFTLHEGRVTAGAEADDILSPLALQVLRGDTTAIPEGPAPSLGSQDAIHYAVGFSPGTSPIAILVSGDQGALRIGQNERDGVTP